MSDDTPAGRLSGDQIAEMGVDDWRSIYLTLRTRFATGDFVTGVRLVNAITEVAEAANHHPDVDLRYPYVDVVLTSHDVNAKTQRDVDLARKISEIARGMGVTAEPARMQEVEIGLDTWDADEIKPFWAAVLGMDASDRFDELNDPSGNLPTIWFRTPTSMTSHASASTSTSGCRPRRQGPASTPRWPRAACWSPTTRRHDSPCSPTARATRCVSALTWAAGTEMVGPPARWAGVPPTHERDASEEHTCEG